MARGRIELIDPTVDLEDTFLDMAAEYARCGEDRYQDLPSPQQGGFAAYVQRLHNGAEAIGLPTGHVPGSTYWLVRGGRRVLGAARLRHHLNESLLAEGGHVGYDVRPSERRKGYGTKLLAMTLEKARAMGLTRLMVSCTSDNVASAKIIRRNGGVFENEVMSPSFRKPLLRFWIEL
ncbi:MAG: GNAT family N-acetyltransferase [Planctomycetota bacterium]|jgi:predicted acetyltransferase